MVSMRGPAIWLGRSGPSLGDGSAGPARPALLRSCGSCTSRRRGRALAPRHRARQKRAATSAAGPGSPRRPLAAPPLGRRQRPLPAASPQGQAQGALCKRPGRAAAGHARARRGRPATRHGVSEARAGRRARARAGCDPWRRRGETPALSPLQARGAGGCWAGGRPPPRPSSRRDSHAVQPLVQVDRRDARRRHRAVGLRRHLGRPFGKGLTRCLGAKT